MAEHGHTRSGRQRVLGALVAGAEPELRRLGASGVAVTLAAHDQLVQLAFSTGPVARELYELQRTLGEGPTLTAVTRGLPIIADLTDHTHETPDVAPDVAPEVLDSNDSGSSDHSHGLAEPWVAFGHEARARGIDRIYAIPLGAGGARVGALTVHVGPPDRRHRSARGGSALGSGLVPGQLVTPDRPGDLPLSGLMRLADRLLLALLAPPNAPAEMADTGIFTTVTHQAAGMVSVQLGVPIADAVVTLQAEAFASERDLVAVSRDVVARRLRFDSGGVHRPPPPPAPSTDPMVATDPIEAGPTPSMPSDNDPTTPDEERGTHDDH